MSPRVRATAAALEDVTAIGQWIVSQGAPVAAERWIVSLMEALWSLSEMPEGYPSAPEATEFDGQIRHLIFGDYRALFTVRGREVFILHVRHGRRQPATVRDLTAAMQEADESGSPPETK